MEEIVQEFSNTNLDEMFAAVRTKLEISSQLPGLPVVIQQISKTDDMKESLGGQHKLHDKQPCPSNDEKEYSTENSRQYKELDGKSRTNNNKNFQHKMNNGRSKRSRRR